MGMSRPLVLVCFSVSWCARCLELSQQLQRAALLLQTLQPAVPVYLAKCDMDDPVNSGWLRNLGIASFPVGKVFRYGTMQGTYLRGPSAPEICAGPPPAGGATS